MKIKICLLVCFCMLSVVLRAQLPLFPTPQSVEMKEGIFEVGSKIQVTNSGNNLEGISQELQTRLIELNGLKSNQNREIKLTLDSNLSLPKEGYIVEITPKFALIQASHEAGLKYGIESFMQLARFSKGQIPCCRIVDEPCFQWRGFMLDESRHFFGMAKVKEYLDWMYRLKMNVFHWHLTDEPGWRIEIKKYPKLTTIGAKGNWHDPEALPQYYTQKEIQEIILYAAERNILIIPEIDMPGHATAVTHAYPVVSGGGEGKWNGFTFHPAKDTTYQFISDILDEIIQLFPSPYIHIGGDEVHYGNQSWFTDPEIQQFIQDKKLGDEKGLEHYFVRRIADLIVSKGKKMIGWDEIVDAEVSPEKAIVMWWRHDKPEQLKKALDRGYQVVMTPRRPFYCDFIQHESHKVGRTWNGFNPLEDQFRFSEQVQEIIQGKSNQILGIQQSMWTERVADNRCLDFMVFPRLIATAEAAWTPSNVKNYKEFLKKLPQFLRWLDTDQIYYFNVFDPSKTPEPGAPDKEDPLKNG